MDNKQKVIDRILNMSEDSGRSGCTYGDTDFDSLSVVYGYNMALNEIKDILKPFKSEPLKKTIDVDVLKNYVDSQIHIIKNALKRIEYKHNILYFNIKDGVFVDWFMVNLKTEEIFISADSEKFGKAFTFKNILSYHGIQEINEIQSFIFDNLGYLDVMFTSFKEYNKYEY